MKIKVTLYGFTSGTIGHDFFEFQGNFHRGLNLGLASTFGPRLTCDELEGIVDEQSLSIPKLYFADFDLSALQIHSLPKLNELAACFGDLFREYVFSFVDNGSFVGVRLIAGGRLAKWSPHHYKLL